MYGDLYQKLALRIWKRLVLPLENRVFKQVNLQLDRTNENANILV